MIQIRRVVQLQLPEAARLFAYVRANARHADRVLTLGAGRGRSVTICGAGPSLSSAAIPDTDEVWACNSALPYLVDRGRRVTHGFAIDSTPDMLSPDEWGRTFDVEYLLASSVYPELVTHLLSAGRRISFFHSYLGIPDPEGWTSPIEGLTHEMWLYTRAGLYDTSFQVGHGLNSVPRAVCAALAMEFDRIVVLGADCACAPDGPPMPMLDSPEYPAWLARLRLYADGRTAARFGPDCEMAEAVIDGRRWHTRPDMLISARNLLDLARDPRVELVGDTLPNVLRGKDEEWMTGMPRLTREGCVVGLGAKLEEKAA